ncbi:hypothetical protein AOQ84DRAFT_377021 [Glonium stellatum]|uniref:Uncharacterized protein n=1 Tax=Glonium stellatum TaxID=574774 RepID=A0A8E2F091_9PEZI|nr:hypothetical protein AOQ84DRAFT_377021 [Glonium stellatum]
MRTFSSTAFLFLIFNILKISRLSTCYFSPPQDPYIHPVFILRGSNPETEILSNALGILGFKGASLSAIASNCSYPMNKSYANQKGVFIEVDRDLDEDFAAIASSYSEAKFLLPTKPPTSMQHTHPDDLKLQQYVNSVRRFFQERDVNQEKILLEIAVGEPEIVVGEKWEQLCIFLGLGYSTLERLRLWRFPSAGGGKEKSAGWGS